MLRALIRFLFVNFYSFFSGLCMIIFDREEIIGTEFYVVEQKNKQEFEQNVLVKHLKNCYRQVNRRDKR